MTDDPKVVVQEAYDHLADWYLQWVDGQRSPRETYTDKVLHASPPSPRILELGCGPGVPVTRMLLDRGAQVVANDISPTQIQMAKGRCPEATYCLGDMATLCFEPVSFDGAVCFFALFHIPRLEQKTVLASICSWLKPGAMLAFNLATIDDEEIYGEMMGHGMYWSSYAVEDSKAMVLQAGFENVGMELIEAGDGQLEESDPDYGVSFVWFSARKPLSQPPSPDQAHDTRPSE